MNSNEDKLRGVLDILGNQGRLVVENAQLKVEADKVPVLQATVKKAAAIIEAQQKEMKAAQAAVAVKEKELDALRGQMTATELEPAEDEGVIAIDKPQAESRAGE